MTLALRRPQTVIEAGDGAGAYWKDLWNYRSLLRFLVRRDLTVHYRQTVIGVAWALLRPLLTIAVFSVFGAVFQTGTEGLPRVLLVAPAALLWQLFSSSVTDASNSLIANANLITKVYFPRSIVPLSSVVVCLVDFLVALSILAVLMFWYGYVPGATVLLVPIFVLLALMSALGAGLLLSALNVKYRDFRYIVPFMVQLGLYVSPVAFSSSAIRATLRLSSPVWLAQPRKTSSGTTPPLRASNFSITSAARSSARTALSAPRSLPTGVRSASMITASRGFTRPPL